MWLWLCHCGCVFVASLDMDVRAVRFPFFFYHFSPCSFGAGAYIWPFSCAPHRAGLDTGQPRDSAGVPRRPLFLFLFAITLIEATATSAAVLDVNKEGGGREVPQDEADLAESPEPPLATSASGSVQESYNRLARLSAAIGRGSAALSQTHARLLAGCESRSKIASVEFAITSACRRSASASGQEPLFTTAGGSFYAIMKGPSVSSRTGSLVLGAGSVVQVRFACSHTTCVAALLFTLHRCLPFMCFCPPSAHLCTHS
jgi:hypothetical protein